MDVYWWAAVVAIMTPILGACYWSFPLIGRWMMMPQLIWGHCDSFSPKGTNGSWVPYSHFYILIKARWFLRPFNPQFPKKIVKLTLKLRSGQPFDFEVNITDFYTTIGCEHLQEVKTVPEKFDGRVVEFELNPYKTYRISIKGSGGSVGNLLSDEFGINIESDNVTVIERPYRPPYSKYIVVNGHRTDS